VVGTDIANRNRAETEGLIGFFVNQLVMRVEVRPEESFRELLRRVREVCLGAYAHQDVPFEKLVEELQPERDLSRSPLFQVKLLLQDAPREELELGGLRLMKDGDGEAQTSRFDLTVAITDAGDDLIGMVEYSSDLFKEGTIERLTGHYVNALKWIAEDVERPISELSLLSEEELEQILVEWNETARPYPNDRCVHELFDEQVENAPEAVALIYQDQRLTYAELDARSSQLARYLRRFGVGPETLVGVCVDRSLEMVVGLLGILKAGGAYVPIDPAYPVERMAFMLDDARVKALLTQDQLLDLLPTNSVQVINLDAEWRVIAAESKERLSSGATAENLAYVIYTSGSTGRPKGVLVPHNQVANFFAAMDANIEHGPDAIWLAVTSISFDISVLELLWTLARGFQVVVHGDVRSGQPADGPQADITENDGRAIYDEDLSVPAQIVRGQVSHLQCTPSMAKMLSLGSDSNGPFSSLRQLLIGGEAFPIELAYDLKPLAPGEIRNMYGPTETTIWSTTYSLRGEERGIPIGRPIANTQTYILDRELGVAPIGVPGELYIGGKGVVRGYLNRSELTAERFLPDSFSREPGARVYRTGDLTRYSADGEIEFLGRIDHQVKIRGYRIELGEIEARLNSHPAVRQCAVIAHNYGKSEKRLAAYMVGEGEGASHASELRAYLKETLPEYMLPARFVWLDQMPLTPNGKVDRRALPAPDVNRSGMTEGYVGPRTPVEQTLARIFQEALRLDQVGIHSSFFELGGDSILGIQIISRANAAGLGLTPRQLFQHQSVAELAAVADVARPSESGEPDVVGEIPLTPVQERFFEEYDRELGSFNQAMILEAREELDIEALRKVVERLLKQHSVLRHRFKKGENGWVQVCEEPDGAAPLEEVSLSTINGGPAVGSIEAAAEKYLKEMNIDQGPLMRVVVFDGGKGGRRHVLIVAHHLVIDEASWRVLSEDLERWYGQARRGEEINPGAKTTSYKRWAESLKEEAQSERSREEAKYWLAQAGMRVRRLPVDKRGANTVASGRIVAASLSVKETAALLKEVVASRKTQIDEILLSAVARAVGEWSGDQIVTVEVEGRGREETIKGLDLTRAVGCFTSRYPLRVELEDGNGAELLRNVKEQMREARRRGVYYGMLKYLSEEPDIREKLRALPEAEISFNYLGEQDSVLREGALFRPANGRILETRSRAGNRRHLIEVNVSIRRGRLQLVWTYSRNVHRRETIATMAESARKALRSLVSEGPSSPEQSYTPSDFPLIDIDQQRLDRILSKRAKMKDDH
jgi:amino acid adenylation domain-containing protein/non-ribosomal peptide synthase protein (TIGR01720 family)